MRKGEKINHDTVSTKPHSYRRRTLQAHIIPPDVLSQLEVYLLQSWSLDAGCPGKGVSLARWLCGSG